MEQTPQQDLTLGQVRGGRLKNLIEQHNLIARQVLTPAEAEKLLNHSVHEPVPPAMADLLDMVIAVTRRPVRPPAAMAPAASLSETVTDLSKLSLDELRKINADYLPENRAKLESVILNPFYAPETRTIRPPSTAH